MDFRHGLIQLRRVAGVDLISDSFSEYASLMTIYKKKIQVLLFSSHFLHLSINLTHYTCFVHFSNQITYILVQFMLQSMQSNHLYTCTTYATKYLPNEPLPRRSLTIHEHEPRRFLIVHEVTALWVFLMHNTHCIIERPSPY